VTQFELVIKKNEEVLWLSAVAAVLIAIIIGLALIGRNYTTVDQAGDPQILSWSGWTLTQAQRAYNAEISVLRNDAIRLAETLNQRPNPVATQMLCEEIFAHTSSGDPSLAGARNALAAAAQNVLAWSTGTLDQAAAIQSLQTAVTLLK
jgi:tRNA A37 N6-isopentenylltransferase MiaA